MEPIETLYIVGNGFDRHHGVRSSYQDFAAYLWRCDRELFATLTTLVTVKELWGDFEYNLAYISRETIAEYIDICLPWKDPEEDDLSVAEYEVAIGQATQMVESCTDRLKYRFHKWVRTLGLPKGHKRRMLAIDKNAYYVNFNYTDFLETLYDIPRSRIAYLHGTKSDKIGSLVLGHGEDPQKNYEEWIHKNKNKKRFRSVQKNKQGNYYNNSRLSYLCFFCDDPETEDWIWPTRYYAIDRIWGEISEYYEKSKKRYEEVIWKFQDTFVQFKGVSRIVVMGHSLSKVDLPYFKEICKAIGCRENVKWEISYFSEKDKARINGFIKLLGIDKSNVSLYQLTDCTLENRQSIYGFTTITC